MLPKLYKKRVEGGLQVWSIEVDGGRYRTVSGMVDGAMVTSEWTDAVVKNSGRANATSIEEQAANEAQSKWTKKYDGGYRETEAELESVDIFKCMLAEKLTDYPVIQFPVHCQPKLDGARAAGRAKTGLWSRKFKPWINTPHIANEVIAVLQAHPTLVLDGELYCDKLADNFNKIISLIKKNKPTPESFAESEKYVRYFVYDCKFEDQPQLTFSERQTKLREILVGFKYFVLVETYLVANQEELDERYAEFLEEGYEGQIIRTDTPYENKRTKALLKRKEFNDGEFELEDVLEGKGNMAGKAGKVLIKGRGKAGLRGNAAYRTDLLLNKDKYIGKPVTIRYQGDFTPEGKFRFGVMIAVRDYE
jgi:ATP-dependent DNA ligase